MAVHYYGAVSNEDGTFTVYAVDQHAQQNFFGWAGESRIGMAFYGNNAEKIPIKLKGRLAPGDMPWKWVLGPEHAREMLDTIEEYGGDSKYYSVDEKRRLPDLVKVLEFIIDG